MLLGTLGASLLGNMLAGKGIVTAGFGNKKGKEIIRAGYENQIDFWCHLWNTLKYRSIIKMNLDSMEFILEIMCLKK